MFKNDRSKVFTDNIEEEMENLISSIDVKQTKAKDIKEKLALDKKALNTIINGNKNMSIMGLKEALIFNKKDFEELISYYYSRYGDSDYQIVKFNVEEYYDKNNGEYICECLMNTAKLKHLFNIDQLDKEIMEVSINKDQVGEVKRNSTIVFNPWNYESKSNNDKLILSSLYPNITKYIKNSNEAVVSYPQDEAYLTLFLQKLVADRYYNMQVRKKDLTLEEMFYSLSDFITECIEYERKLIEESEKEEEIGYNDFENVYLTQKYKS